MSNPTKILFFETADEARAYRHKHGTGGWIFSGDVIGGHDPEGILFPPDMAPSDIFHHRLLRGRSGTLIP